MTKEDFDFLNKDEFIFMIEQLHRDIENLKKENEELEKENKFLKQEIADIKSLVEVVE